MKAIYPVVCVESPRQAAAALAEHLGLSPVFEEDWYVHLVDTETHAQMGLVRSDHESVPTGLRSSLSGIVTVEPGSVTEVWERLRHRVQILTPLRDEAWGQRRFMALLPGNLVVDFVEMIDGA
jgi:hypothetical protein